MSTHAPYMAGEIQHPVRVYVEPAIDGRNRLTTAFRIILAIPHLLLVGGPMAGTLSWNSQSDSGNRSESGASGGVLGLAAGIVAIIAWFAILFTGRYPQGLRDFVTFYMRWRVRAIAYTALLRDEYPPFGEGPYPVAMEVTESDAPRNRLSVAFRIFLAIPQLIVLWFLGFAWCIVTVISWFAILFTGHHPAGLYEFGVGVLRWNTRVEAYMLLLHDDYPPFSLE